MCTVCTVINCTVFSRWHRFVLVQIFAERFFFSLEATDRLCGAVGKRPRITSIQNNLSDESFVNSNPVLSADVFSFKQKWNLREMGCRDSTNSALYVFYLILLLIRQRSRYIDSDTTATCKLPSLGVSVWRLPRLVWNITFVFFSLILNPTSLPLFPALIYSKRFPRMFISSAYPTIFTDLSAKVYLVFTESFLAALKNTRFLQRSNQKRIYAKLVMLCWSRRSPFALHFVGQYFNRVSSYMCRCPFRSVRQ